MRFSDQLVLALSLLTVSSLAKPTNPNTFHIDQIPNKGFSREHRGRHAIRKAHRKFNNKLRNTPAAPPLSKTQKPLTSKNKASFGKSKAADPNASTEQAKPDDQFVQYVCEVEVGGQKARLNFDTGSSDLYEILESINWSFSG